MILWSVMSAFGCEPRFLPTTHIDLDKVEAAAGEPSDTDDLSLWSIGATERILALYEVYGLDAARVWSKVEDGCLLFDIDEGKLDQVLVNGASTLDRLTLPDNIDTREDRIYDRFLAEKAATRVKRMADIDTVTWQIIPSDTKRKNRFGDLVDGQMIEVTLGGEEDSGFGVKLDTVQRFGIVTGLTWTKRSKRWGQFRTGLFLGTPYHRWAIEQEPQFRFTYGAYQLRWDGNADIAPYVGFQLVGGNWQRVDLGLERAFVPSARVDFGATFGRWDHLSVQVGAALETADTWDIRRFEGATFEPRTDKVARVLGTFAIRWQPSDRPIRSDLQTEVLVQFEGGIDEELDPLMRSTLSGKAAKQLGRHWAVFRGLGTYRAGALRFYDDLPIGGDYQRVFFQDQYWSKKAAQVEVGFRYTLGQRIALGVYHDISAFEDAETKELLFVNAVGPGAHLLLLNLFEVDFYWGAGWSSDNNFSQNIHIDVSTVY